MICDHDKTQRPASRGTTTTPETENTNTIDLYDDQLLLYPANKSIHE
jgi:hypothetical protein